MGPRVKQERRLILSLSNFAAILIEYVARLYSHNIIRSLFSAVWIFNLK